jgi:DNA polymerase III delta prime subunit
MSKDFLWCEKYRPKTVSETILPPNLKNTFQSMIDTGELQNMLFTGTAGLGKTTVAKALCNELGLDYIIINGSEEGNIDTLRGKIKQFASTVSFFGAGYKVVILDEADYMNAQSTQPALRGFIEQFSDNCRFILTCNFKNRIIEPLHSRCSVYEFNTTKKDMAPLAAQMMKRLQTILNDEGVTYQDKDLADIIMKYTPDWRRVINEIQRNSSRGVLNASTAMAGTTVQFDELFAFLKNKDFKKMRQWVVNNMDLDTSAIIRGIYDRIIDKVNPASIPQIVLILADYQYKAAFVADHELNLVACMTEIMAEVSMQ